MNFKGILHLCIIAFILVMGCNRSKELPEVIEADYLQYAVNYLEERAGDIPTRILPPTMEAYYTRYFVLTRIEGFFGQFSIIQIANLRSKQVSTLLNFFGNKVYYTGKHGELPAGIIPINNMKLKHTSDTITIAGLTSHCINITTTDEQYDIYCTKQVNVKRPNITTPYNSVNYALSDFRIQLSYLKMHLICVEHDKRLIESRVFVIPEEYKPVSKKAIEEIINSLFTKD